MGDRPKDSLACVTHGITPSRATRVLPQDELEACRRWIAEHSKSFYLSSWLLPRDVREASWALYAFCRRADDAVDELEARADPLKNVELLRARLSDVYRGTPPPHPIDRAFARVAQHYEIPESLPGALLDGMQMDAHGRQYESTEDLLLYCFRVASVVGLMMTCIMLGSARAPRIVWLRAADLGIAMQLTNIARDVGEDARRGRVYIPSAWLEDVGIDRESLLTLDRSTPATKALTRRALFVRASIWRAELIDYDKIPCNFHG
jgi:phytoene synthase